MTKDQARPEVVAADVAVAAHRIEGTPTSITAFIGQTQKGPVNQPVEIHSFDEFKTNFGDAEENSPLLDAVLLFYKNGGSRAYIVRITNRAKKAELAIPGTPWILQAVNPGTWGNNIRINVSPNPQRAGKMDVTLQEKTGDRIMAEENYPNVGMSEATIISSLRRVLNRVSRLASVSLRQTINPGKLPKTWTANLTGGKDGSALTAQQVSAPDLAAKHLGLWALDQVDLFNILCIPPFGNGRDVDVTTWRAAIDYCETRRAFLIIDPPAAWRTAADAEAHCPVDLPHSPNAALYFPYLLMENPQSKNQLKTVAPCGPLAGDYVKTDGLRGVWKAPAGLELNDIAGCAVAISTKEYEDLNLLGINAIRTFPGGATAAWGTRTLSNDPTWKYIPTRRLALFIEESVYRGLQWVLAEPNTEPTWAAIRASVNSFMGALFHQGAFHGNLPHEAFFVKCGRDTMSQDDINNGRINVLAGFAPLKPGEFVVLRIELAAKKP